MDEQKFWNWYFGQVFLKSWLWPCLELSRLFFDAVALWSVGTSWHCKTFFLLMNYGSILEIACLIWMIFSMQILYIIKMCLFINLQPWPTYFSTRLFLGKTFYFCVCNILKTKARLLWCLVCKHFRWWRYAFFHRSADLIYLFQNDAAFGKNLILLLSPIFCLYVTILLPMCYHGLQLFC